MVEFAKFKMSPRGNQNFLNLDQQWRHCRRLCNQIIKGPTLEVVELENICAEAFYSNHCCRMARFYLLIKLVECHEVGPTTATFDFIQAVENKIIREEKQKIYICKNLPK